MAITLEKNKPLSLVKNNAGLQNIIAGLGWDNAPVNNQKVDCDVSVFMLNAGGKIPQDEFFIFYIPEMLFPRFGFVYCYGEIEELNLWVDLGKADPY